MLNRLLRWHRYLAYHACLWQKYMGSLVPEGAAVIQMAVSIFLDLMFVAMMVDELVGIEVPPLGFGPWGAVLTVAILMGVEFWCLMARGRFDKIKQEFQLSSESNIRRGRRIVLLFSFGSLLLVLLVPILFSLRS